MSNGLNNLQSIVQALVKDGKPPITSPFGSAARPEIYIHAYRARLSEILGQEFERVRSHCGADAFDRLADAYMTAVPSVHRDARHWATGFAPFVADIVSTGSAIGDIARFEAALRHAFDAADAQPISIGDIGAINPEHWAAMRFAFHPSVLRLTCRCNPDVLWGNRDQAITDQTTHYVIWRQGLSPMFRALDEVEAAALDCALTGADFGAVCALIDEGFGVESAPALAARLLRTWVEPGLIIAVTLTAD